MRRLTDALVVYTETQARELRARMPGAEITATPNALYSVNEIGPAPGASPRTFVYVGRLVESKKPGLALTRSSEFDATSARLHTRLRRRRSAARTATVDGSSRRCPRSGSLGYL